MDGLLADLKYALRQLRKSPGFAVTAVLTLALGIGANAVVFSVLNALVIRPLALPHAENLYFLQRLPVDSPSNSYPDYKDLRDRNTAFSGLAAYKIDQAGIDTGKNPSVAWLYEATGNYFDVAGVQPYLGRFFHASDEHGLNGSPYVVLSYAYWQAHFQGDTQIVDKTVQLDKHPFTVLGIAPPKFRGTELFFVPDLWIPMMNAQQIDGWDPMLDRGIHSMFVIGRLKSGVTATQGAANLNSVSANLAKTYPKEDQNLQFQLVHPGLVGNTLGRPVRAFAGGLMVLAGLILLAACANLGSLFAARASDRSKEVAIRLALGSSHRRLLRQLLTEAVLVSLIGGTVGLLGADMLLHWLSGWQPLPNIPINVPVDPDATTYVVAFGLSVLSGILFGLVPVRQVMRSNAYQVIKAGPGGAATFRRLTMRDVLLMAQVAVCAVLITSSLVAVRGLVRSLHSNFGFDPQGVMLASFDLQMSGRSGDAAAAFQKRTLEAAQQIPGVSHVAYATYLPLELEQSDSTVFRDGTADFRSANAAADANEYDVSPGYFGAAGTPLIAGRDFTWHDDKNAPLVAIVNETFARKVFGSVEKAIGHYYLKRAGSRVQVIGVAQDGKYRTLTEEPTAAMFSAIAQAPYTETKLLVRSHMEPQQVAAALDKTLRSLDSELPFTLETWPNRLGGALFAARTATVALGVMGALGAMLAVTGIFGMASYSVSKRLREIGIRMALGAQRKEVLQAALGRSFKVLAAGSVVGLLLGIAASRVLAAVVYQATSRDPLVLFGVVIAMALLGLVASWLPARRAIAVNPVMLMREE